MKRTDHPDDCDLIGIEAVAALLGVSYQTIRRLTAAGKLPEPIRLGRLVRWYRPAILVKLAG